MPPDKDNSLGGIFFISQLHPNTIQKDKKFRSIIILSDDEKNKTC